MVYFAVQDVSEGYMLDSEWIYKYKLHGFLNIKHKPKAIINLYIKNKHLLILIKNFMQHYCIWQFDSKPLYHDTDCVSYKCLQESRLWVVWDFLEVGSFRLYITENIFFCFLLLLLLVVFEEVSEYSSVLRKKFLFVVRRNHILKEIVYISATSANTKSEQTSQGHLIASSSWCHEDTCLRWPTKQMVGR